MDKWVCTACGYVYDPAEGDSEGGIAPETAFEDLPDSVLSQLRRRQRILRKTRITTLREKGSLLWIWTAASKFAVFARIGRVNGNG